MKLRKVPFAEKEAYYRKVMGGPSEMKHMEGDGTIRALTDEEWRMWVEKAPHIDVHGANADALDTNYMSSRKLYYPETNAQLGAIWKALDAIQASGVDLGTSATAMLTNIKAIKEKYPKSASVAKYEADNNLELDNINRTEKPGES